MIYLNLVLTDDNLIQSSSVGHQKAEVHWQALGGVEETVNTPLVKVI
ncbi:MAG: hypothetical protein US19_C0051G0009 [Candidatus Daviesbacteria bacterium GW2011_GWB1_36_5]|uniref:Uncharacterized protein n=1 Tax=Candidatus Daviesbacteria bacterium GW2011_GWB1_36_5 TaxID=1618426 RepID=A0A0G0EP50_9BACT|nr:MAG: hypothetical protein US19_C0051G0009 [Candidatus Daviesbacteria bacterium GW2011_GWB1_36_5]